MHHYGNAPLLYVHCTYLYYTYTANNYPYMHIHKHILAYDITYSVIKTAKTISGALQYSIMVNNWSAIS